jgi:hypothetical protein
MSADWVALAWSCAVGGSPTYSMATTYFNIYIYVVLSVSVPWAVLPATSIQIRIELQYTVYRYGKKCFIRSTNIDPNKET